jgi:hypothetical protein
MPVQGLALSAVTDATFNGSAVDKVNLNGVEIWVGGINISPLGTNVIRGIFRQSEIFNNLYVATNGDVYVMSGTHSTGGFGSPAYTDILTGTKTLDGRTVTLYPVISFDANGNLKAQPLQKYNNREYDGYNNIFISYLNVTTNASAQQYILIEVLILTQLLVAITQMVAQPLRGILVAKHLAQ